MTMSNVAFIPARGGSKRIPDKNIKEFNDVPALGRVVEAIKSTGMFDTILVSTDSEKIKSVARSFGAEVIMRDPKLANDIVGLLEVVQADLESIELIVGSADLLACVLPTALLMSPVDLESATRFVSDGISPFVVSVGRFRYPIQRAIRIMDDSQIEMVWPENYSRRSQDLEDLHHDAGQFYVGTVEAWRTRQTMFDLPATAIVIDDWRVQDIDIAADWTRTEKLWRVLESD